MGQKFYNNKERCIYGTGAQAPIHNIKQRRAVKVEVEKPNIKLYFSAWLLGYRRTGHRSKYNSTHGSNTTGGLTTHHNKIQRMAFTVEEDRTLIGK